MFHINYQMEEKKAEIKNYLNSVVTPFLTPLMEEMAWKKPSNLAEFGYNYFGKILNEQRNADYQASSENSEDDLELEDLKQKKNQRKMSRQGISAQVYGQFNKKEDFVPKVIAKDPDTVRAITDLIKKSILFENIADEDISILVNAMTMEYHKVNDLIIRENQKGEILYVVGEGEYICSKMVDGKQTDLKTYVKGDSFGELALMYNAPRAATIVCQKQGVLYGLDRQTFKNIVQESADRRRQKFRQMLSNISILSEIDLQEKEQLCDILKEQNYQEGDYVVKEGEEGDKFYMIVEGNLIAEKNHKKVFQFKEGEYFGEISLIRDMPRQASVKCMSPCKLISIERETFKRMFGPIEEILKRNEEKYKQYITA